jgi:hypothetical protein
MNGPVRYEQNPGVSETELDGEIFLVEPISEEVFYLDEIAAGLWRLIAEPRSLEETLAVYLTAFPDADADAVEKDLEEALKILLERGLVHATP